MLRFTLRRLAQTIPLLLLLSLLVFGLFRAIPGDYLSEMELNPTIAPETVEQLRARYGIDQPVVVQYLRWLGSLISGDLGYSFAQRRAAAGIIGERVANTLLLGAAALVMTIALSIPTAVVAARLAGRWPDRLVLFVSLAGLSLPSLLAALLFLYLAYLSGWFPLTAGEPGGLILPALTLAIPATAFIVRTFRAELLDALEAPFIRALAARGLPSSIVLRHAARNALNPVISLLGVVAGSFLSGAVVVEKVFQWPGLGALAVDSILERDLFVALNTLLVGALLTVAANLAADILLACNDPRVRSS